ncbi:MAG TPA: hypothetical protein VLX28_17150 [Thermoanaerobaculia bacterium]|nr:hypothetical protein [Thermoanaerobaculia bacterium]
MTPATAENTYDSTLQTCGAFRRFFESQCKTFEREVGSRYGKAVHVDVGFCADSSLNAFAVRHSKNAYVIGIHTGALVILANVFMDLFSRSPRLCAEMELGTAQARFPREGILANTAFFAATHFLFSHELGHIAYGHTDFCQKSNHLLLEAGSSQASGPVSSELLQSIEVDADLHASTSVMGHLATGQLCGIPMKDALKSRTDLLQLTMIAVLTMFHMFYGENVSISSFETRSHPLPELRLLKFLMRAAQMQANLLPKEAFEVNVMDKITREIQFCVPDELKGAVFPALKLEGRVDLTKEAARVRANEDRYEKLLAEYTILPVGGIVV